MDWAAISAKLISDAAQPNLALTVLSLLTITWQIVDSVIGTVWGSREVRELARSVRTNERLTRELIRGRASS
jgi:hypothetical protein